MNVLRMAATVVAAAAVVFSPLAVASSATAAPAGDTGGSASAAAYPAWSSFTAKKVKGLVPYRGKYYVPDKKTVVGSYRTTGLTAKSNGSVVYVKFPTGWKKVPYRYVKSTNSLKYDEALRLKLGIATDPLGGAKPTYIYKTYAEATSGDTASGGGNLGCLTCTGETPTGGYATGVTTGAYDIDPGAEATLGGNWRNDMVGSLNSIRAGQGAGPVVLCQTLNNAAQGWARYMADNNYFSHSVNGWAPWDRMSQARYGIAPPLNGENIAKNYFSVGDVMNGWVGSPSHYSNMIHPGYVHVGFGAAKAANGDVYIVQNFGGGGTC